ncbi:hypothetical protein T440DRAFT_471498 [Plenodomus tracheiphilus IPT5]|uniref:Uncharacterized protein n=1 Tax=Plenodomus tracheiphilus IPT5 TaxID=1408161 RepID=A0A6A7AX98_9PLEO|nr:hypothetical protein T440DRAFT_471498 [Plenodomus tracheiphilus IPT5]
MRSSVIIASLIALAAALPAIVPVEETSLAVRTESLDASAALEPRQAFINFDRNFDWPETNIINGGRDAQFQATNKGDGNYKFQFWNTANKLDLNYRVSYGGKTLATAVLSPGQTATTDNVPKTGETFNVFIKQN